MTDIILQTIIDGYTQLLLSQTWAILVLVLLTNHLFYTVGFFKGSSPMGFIEKFFLVMVVCVTILLIIFFAPIFAGKLMHDAIT